MYSTDVEPGVPPLNGRRLRGYALGLFFFARLVLLLALPLEGLRGYGDLTHFFRLGQIPGWPFLNYWSEFPPVFPFLYSLLYRLAGGQEHVFDYLLVFVLSLADAGNLLLFWRLAEKIHGKGWVAAFRIAIYLFLLVALPYQWWYFDPLAVFFMLLGLSLLLDGKSLRGGLALGAGALIKFFPALTLVWAWRSLPVKKAILVTVVTLGMVAAVYAGLYAASPRFTLASLGTQGSKGSWETVWSLIDGNVQNGNFGPLVLRLDPAAATQPRGNPAVVPPLAALAVFGGLGLWGFLRSKPQGDQAGLSLVGLAWCLFLLWSPAWSVQWMLYLLPLILLALPLRLGVQLSGVFVLVNLLEWPVLLSRGLFDLRAAPILLRTLVLVLLAMLFYDQAKINREDAKSAKIFK